MATDHIRYDILAQNALLGVVRSVLADAAKNGLLGDHHFKITFDTRAAGVRLPPRLHEQYPQEMTIILQYEFWDLQVGDNAFEVGLSFGGIRERLRIPFEAITGFFDPAVQFGLQFATVVEEDAEDSPAAETAKAAVREESLPLRQGEKAPAALPSPPDRERREAPATGAEVVRLDRFRKK